LVKLKKSKPRGAHRQPPGPNHGPRPDRTDCPQRAAAAPRHYPPPPFTSGRPYLTVLVLPVSYFLPTAPKLIHHPPRCPSLPAPPEFGRAAVDQRLGSKLPCLLVLGRKAKSAGNSWPGRPDWHRRRSSCYNDVFLFTFLIIQNHF
jgi:hypothetical protein